MQSVPVTPKETGLRKDEGNLMFFWGFLKTMQQDALKSIQEFTREERGIRIWKLYYYNNPYKKYPEVIQYLANISLWLGCHR